MSLLLSNYDRAIRARLALNTYRAVYGDTGTDPEEDVSDILTDLRHYCDTLGLSFGDLDRMAYANYVIEKAEEGGAP